MTLPMIPRRPAVQRFVEMKMAALQTPKDLPPSILPINGTNAMKALARLV
jgi:hypothetical protein